MSTNHLHTMSKSGVTPHDRLSHILDDILEEVNSSSPSNSKLTSLVAKAKQLNDGYDEYASLMTSPEPKIVEKLSKMTKDTNWRQLHADGKTKFELIPEMSAGGYEGSVLTYFAKMSKAKRVLEVGMFTGTTTAALALVPTVEHITALDIEPFLKEVTEPYFREAGILKKIDVRIGDAKDALKTLAKELKKFDMVFIDADKPSYLTYLDLVLHAQNRTHSLLAPGGVIFVDNTAYQGGPWCPAEHIDHGKVIDDFNKEVRSRENLDVVFLAIEDGITVIRRVGE